MATSGSIDWNLTRNQVIRMAALEVHAIGAGITMGAQMLDDFAVKLNAMIHSWQGLGIHVWTVEEATLFPQLDQVKYQLGNSSPDHCAQTYVETAISAEEASGQTTISIDSSAGMTAADNIGIIVDDGTIHWSTISSIPDSTSVVIADALDDSAAVDNPVFAYKTKINRPLKVVDARRYNISSDNETPIDMVARRDYQALPNKTTEGTINQCWYEPGRDTGYLYVWPEPANIDDLVKFTWHRPLEDFDAAGNNPDLPQEWVLALAFNLAEASLAQYPVDNKIALRVTGLATKYLDIVRGFDQEEGSVYFQPDLDPYY